MYRNLFENVAFYQIFKNFAIKKYDTSFCHHVSHDVSQKFQIEVSDAKSSWGGPGLERNAEAD